MLPFVFLKIFKLIKLSQVIPLAEVKGIINLRYFHPPKLVVEEDTKFDEPPFWKVAEHENPTVLFVEVSSVNLTAM